MVELRNLRKSYDGGRVLAVDDLSLTVQPGEIFGFLGPNGAGKTTTIRMMVGILPPDSGRVIIDGIDMAERPIEAKRRIGFVPDTPEVYERLTGIEYLRFLADVYGVDARQRRERIERLASLFQLEDALGDRIASYSHGMRQKLVLIGALIHDPPVWVLDEPMVGLDPRSAHELKNLMAEHCAAGRTVFFSTHILEVAERLCHRVGIIHRGRLIACGTLEELRAQAAAGSETLESLFLELTEHE